MTKASPFLIQNKFFYRSLLREVRSTLSPDRRAQAASDLFQSLSAALIDYSYVLSFASLPGEIDLTLLNQQLAREKRLLLPKVMGETFSIFAVTDIATQMEYCAPIYEPKPQLCEEINLNKLDCILVPGLGFDPAGNRLGYGKGYYDRFLQTLASKELHPMCIGIGFKEQLLAEPLPAESHDFRLDQLALF